MAAMPVIIHPITGLNWKQAVRISSLEKKPENGQIPEIARQAIRNVQWVTTYAASRHVLNKMSWEKLEAIKDSLNREPEESVEAPKSQSNEQIEETKPITRPQRKNIARRPNRGRSWVTSF